MSFKDYMMNLFPTAFMETLYMILVPTLIASIIGFIIAIILVITKDDGLKPNKTVYNTLGLIVNIFRSFPFIILIVAISSFTRYSGPSTNYSWYSTFHCKIDRVVFK